MTLEFFLVNLVKKGLILLLDVSYLKFNVLKLFNIFVNSLLRYIYCVYAIIFCTALPLVNLLYYFSTPK